MMTQEITLTRLASHLVQHGLLDTATAVHALQQANLKKLSLIYYLVTHKILSSQAIANLCQTIFNLPIFDLTHYDISWLKKSPLNNDFVRTYRVIPMNIMNNTFRVGVIDPFDQDTLDVIVFHTGLHVAPVIVTQEQHAQFLDLHYSEKEANLILQQKLLKKITEETAHIIQENTIHYDEPLIQFVDNIIQHAVQQNVSDIHIEPYETICRIRYRQHGVLQEINQIPNALASRIATRLKVMAKLDIAERRLPQDGRFQLNDIDLRINTCPTFCGEKVVLRLLNSAKLALEISQLGMTSEQQKIFINALNQPQGMILVTGPTGSGKTVTLYSALHRLNKTEKNICTAEDPIEIRLHGINQVNVNPKIGLHFTTVLRAFLRQDPDIIMLGEIRDTETADIALKAAQTGHLVLSTLHTNNAVESISRLRSIGMLSYNIASSISLIIAQRLIRKLCSQCKIPEAISPETLAKLGIAITPTQPIYRAQGCQHCTQGYTQRMAIYEFLPITEKISKLIATESETFTIVQTAKITTLREIGLKKILQGETSLAELNRVLQL